LMQCLEELKDAKEDDYKKLASRYLWWISKMYEKISLALRMAF
jgi:hypothetical protein